MTTDRVFPFAFGPRVRARRLAVGLALVASLAGLAPRLAAQSYLPLSETEMVQPPKADRLAGLAAYASKTDWAQLSPMFRQAALQAYEKGSLPAAERWLQVYRWSVLLGRQENLFIQQWIGRIQAAHLVHANLPHKYVAAKKRLGEWLSPELQAWVVSDAAFSGQFFGLFSPLDYQPDVLRILNELHQHDPARFAKYANLALAIAVDYDLPPPPDWPHGQVTADRLPRHLPAPLEAFDWWVRQDEANRTYHHLAELDAEELKFVVDVAAPFPELSWARRNVEVPLNQLARAYSMVRYDVGRETGQIYVWPHGAYTLQAVLQAGGICVDQAYFAIEFGKSRGVPTLLFSGEGQDGRHAWFGYLDGERRWQLDAGRYGEQRYVTGIARDPQTQQEFSDHELQFLSERFRALPTYRTSLIHADFASEYLEGGDAATAIRAAWTGIRFEPRNVGAWETLLAAQQKQGDAPKLIEATLYQAVAAFARYPDLEVDFSSRLRRSLRGRGQLSAAEVEERRLLDKNQRVRADLTLARDRDDLEQTWNTKPLAESMAAYTHLLETRGRGAGIDFYDRIVTPFVRQLAAAGHLAEARQAAGKAFTVMHVRAGSQLDGEFTSLFRELRTAPRPAH